MATQFFLSQHSSNPLEVASSDARNKSYVKRYQRAKDNQHQVSSSDDPYNGENVPEMEQYHTHLAQLYASASQHRDQPPLLVDLDDVMDSEEEHAAEEEQEQNDLDEDGVEEDTQGETDEEMSIYLKSREEQIEIEEEISDLEAAVPQLTQDYKIVDRLGTGTFSSVYKAIDLGYHDKWDNTVWHGRHPPGSSAFYQSIIRSQGSKVFVAIKRIYVTSGPERIRNELSIMEDCRSCRHVSQLITAFRHYDQIVAIMPYHRNDDFRDFFRVLPMEGIKSYFRCMFRALRDIHTRAIIHRDVKPANFLFDPTTGIGTLCDFGLACRMDKAQSLGSCLHTSPTGKYPHGRLRTPDEYDAEYVKKMQKEARLKSSMPSDRVGYPEKDTRPHSKANRAGTRGFRAPEVLLKCGDQSGAIDMWSAGMILLFFLTQKFPILQSNDDVESLMEIATIVGRRRMEKTATLHSRIFQTNVPSISYEGVSWRDFVERQNPQLRDLPPADTRFYPYTLPQYNPSQWANPPPPSSSSPQSRYSSSRSPSPLRAKSPPPVRGPTKEQHEQDVDYALDLLEQLLQPDSIRRIIPKKALAHPFLKEPAPVVARALANVPEDEPMFLDDDEFMPRPFGHGVCASLHFYDEVTDEPCVRVKVRGRDGRIKEETEVRRLSAGEGICYGQAPCEFHREELGYKWS